jgi:hypothetical protein
MPFNFKNFIPIRQLRTMTNNLNGEEKNHFSEKFSEIEKQISETPDLYAQDGKGNDAIVHLHYFYGGCDWFITEADKKTGELFGYCDLGMGCPELGYVALSELTRGNIELDLYWKKKTLGEIKKARN